MVDGRARWFSGRNCGLVDRLKLDGAELSEASSGAARGGLGLAVKAPETAFPVPTQIWDSDN